MGRLLIATSLLVSAAIAQTPAANDTTPFVSIHAPVLALTHVRVIDGTGAPAKENQTLVIADGKIQAVGDFASVQIPANAQQLDRTGYTVIPGLVGMHNHLYYTDSIAMQRGASGTVDEPGAVIVEIPFTGPRLYLAAGVTTMRTTGSLEPLHRYQGETADRCRSDARSKDRPHLALS